jgi:hypothetical protein
LPEIIETRPFPEDFTGSNSDSQLATLEQMKNIFGQELKHLLEREFSGQLAELREASYNAKRPF